MLLFFGPELILDKAFTRLLGTKSPDPFLKVGWASVMWPLTPNAQLSHLVWRFITEPGELFCLRNIRDSVISGTVTGLRKTPLYGGKCFLQDTISMIISTGLLETEPK